MQKFLPLNGKKNFIQKCINFFLKSDTILPVFFGDGYKGLPNFAPFDKIIVTAGATYIPEDLKQQLAINGRMVIPVGNEQRQEMIVVTRISDDEFRSEKHGDFVFVPLLKGTVNF